MNIKKHDVLLVDYPFTNLQGTKLRPALVLKVLEGKNIIFCQITTKKQLLENYSVFFPKTSCSFDLTPILTSKFYLHSSGIAFVGE